MTVVYEADEFVIDFIEVPEEIALKYKRNKSYVNVDSKWYERSLKRLK